MDSATAADEPQRAKFLCSFGGSILPRPVDGRLRYVGGETRIVALPRDITFDDLLARMRELFEGATVIKYQQPDEDLDALVSVVNNDDVVNMMEEYDKLASTVSGDGGLARLRIFLSTHHNPDPDAAAAAAAAHFDVDERETERRYVEALNSLGGSSSSPDVHEHYLGPGLHQLNISHPHPHPHARHSEVESSWSSPYFLPGRDLRESPNSPSSAVQLDQQASPMMENNMMWTSAGAVVQENAGFPGNLGHTHNAFDGSSITCERCRIAYPRYLDPKWNGGSEYMGQFSGSCADCYTNRELPSSPFVNEDHHGHDHDHRWLPHPHHQSIQRGVEDPRIYLSGTGGRVGDHYVVDGNMMNSPFGHGNLYDGHHDGRYLRPPAPPINDFGGERFNLQQGAVHGNHYPSHYGAENPNPYQVPRNLPPVQNFQRNLQVTVCPLMMSNGFVRSAQEVSPRFHRLGLEDHSQHPSKAHNDNLSLKHCGADHHNDRLDVHIVNQVVGVSDPLGVNVRARIEDPKEEILNMKGVTPTEAAKLGQGCNASPGCLTYLPKLVASVKNAVLENAEEVKTRAEENPTEAAKLGEGCSASPECLAYVPELVASVKNTVLENVEEVKTRAEVNPTEQKEPSPEVGLGNGQAELDAVTDGDADHYEVSKIETTTAEAEALAQGLQTIKNDDLEEIRELGSGTYGSVYHGKWKGSDVAVKRIKASCFTGKPSERERLIADFWKEALILSSLHHPNVVSFYGVVRDGPDGSLATVTEFMVNGSLKQFLQKKDRTIDRRKRLIIAMDAAFGMEYLHAKNIVHFDLKCENLLVNMRDPQRPICKIGDLGLSKVKQHTLVSGGVRGTLPWMAPELLSGKKNMVTEKVDVYSFGIVMWELLTGEEPYGDMHCGSIIGGIMSNTLRPQIPTWCDPEWRSLMESCWSSTPAERPSFSEISQKLRKMAAAINVK